MAQEDEDYEDVTAEFLKKNPELAEPAREETAPQAEPEPEPAPEVTEESAGDRTEVEPAPQDEPAPAEDDWKKSDVFTDMEKMSHGFRKRIEKLNSKHQTEMDELRNSYEARLKALEERTAPKPEVKGRDAFKTDEDYMKYLVREELKQDEADRQRQSAEASARQAEEDKARREQEADIARRQDTFRRNTENSFDTDGKARFMGRVQYAMEHGFGDVLDANPAASDYLLGNRMGPKVLDHILNNPDEFRDVFMNQGQSQMDQYYTLKQIEGRVLAEGRGEAEAAPATELPRSKVRLGKPGGQGASTAGFTNHDDPRARRAYLEKLGIC